MAEQSVRVRAGAVTLDGDLTLPDGARAIVLFAHGSGSSRLSPRNRHVAELLNEAGLATLLVDLLTPEEEVTDARTARLRFDIRLLAERLVEVTDCSASARRRAGSGSVTSAPAPAPPPPSSRRPCAQPRWAPSSRGAGGRTSPAARWRSCARRRC